MGGYVRCVLVWALALAALARAEAPRPWRALGAAAAYRLETTLQLNDAGRTAKEVGYKLRARLRMRPLWARADADEFLLEFQLQAPQLLLRGKHVNADFMPYASVWDSVGDTTFYAHWSRGLIEQAYLNPDQLTDVLNYQKAIISLFQFQMVNGEHNETDVSGSCEVLYETMSTDVFRKIKRRCVGDEEAGIVSARRLARYSLSQQSGQAGQAGQAEQLVALHAEELLVVGHAQLGVKVRSWHTLTADAAPPAPPAPRAPAAALPAALAAIPGTHRAEPLTLRPPRDDDEDHDYDDEEEEEEELGAAVERWADVLADDAPGAGGGAAGARAALLLAPRLRRAPRAALLALLAAPRLAPALPGLLRLLGLAGSRAAVAAAAAHLQLAAREPLRDLAHVFLAAFALAPHPEEGAVLDVLRLADDAKDESVASAALLAAAAAATRAAGAAPVARQAAARQLARCAGAECRAPRLLALANLRAAAADLVLPHAERADGAAGAALAALQAAPGPLSPAHMERLERLALRRDAPLELRAAAVEQLVERRARLPAPLAALAGALYHGGGADGDAHELRRVLWGRVATLAPHSAALRALPRQLEAALRGWDAAAPGGSSAALARAPGWAAGGWRARLQALQVARAGLLRRGAVRLEALDPSNRTYDVLSIEVWTRGLETFSGGAADGAEGAEGAGGAAGADSEPAAGLALAVGGARLPPLELFRGQAALLAHVWAGTASAPTPALRALWALPARGARVALAAGQWARAHAGAAAALALDAQATLSLWWRSARAVLRMRGGAAAAARLSLRPAWGRLAAAARLELEPRLRVGADLDFYSAVALCVRPDAAPLELRRRVELRADQGGGAAGGAGGAGARLRVRRRREELTRLPGRTLALGRPNDVTCRTLRAADEAEDDAA